MKDNFLSSFGFSDREFLIYTLLVTRGPLTMSEIVTVSKLHRPYTYKTVALLLEKQAVSSSIVKKRKVYSALSPHTLKRFLQEKQEVVSKKLDDLEESYIAPHLETTVTHYQGKKGVTAIFSDLVHSQKKGDIFYRYTSESDTEYVDTFLPKDYRIIRDKKALERFVISSIAGTKTKQKHLEKSCKVVPVNESRFSQNCIQLLYADKVAFINISKLQGVIIEDENIASFQREIFKLLYKRL